jgi:3-(3-hydroxy-phenyl)propionate hydroxylase
MVAIESNGDGVTIQVACADDHYRLDATWVAACDGWRSPTRAELGLDFEGKVFEDNFLIADVSIRQDRAAERWFWFDPPFNRGQSALLHKQPGGVWRLDFQLGWEIDRERCRQPEFVEPLVRGMLGDDVEFRGEWYSVYTFQCRRMARFVHDNIVFAGDSAHVVSPFGARGCNGGIADADNLGWKLDLVLGGQAPLGLLQSYDHEAIVTADENILASTRSTDFMTPKSWIAGIFRDAVLELAKENAFVRPFVNSGRLSTAVSYPNSPLNTPDTDDWAGGVQPGSPALDAPTSQGWLLGCIGGSFSLLHDGGRPSVAPNIECVDVNEIGDPTGLVRSRYELEAGAAYLIRPDQYVAARWKNAGNGNIGAALARASGQ